MYTHIHTHIQSYTHTYIYIFHVCIFMFVYMYFVCKYKYTAININIKIHIWSQEVPSFPQQEVRSGGIRKGKPRHLPPARLTPQDLGCWSPARHTQPTSCESLYLSKRRPPETPSQPTAHRQQGNCCTCQPRFHDGNLSWSQPVRNKKVIRELLQALSDTCFDLLFHCTFLFVLSKGSARNHILPNAYANA